MLKDGKLLIGKGENEANIIPRMANRHGLICGATGTGKTITLKVMAESFSDLGVPVFLADIKGDLGGCVVKGQRNENIDKRLNKMGIDPETFEYKSYPVRFWDVFGEGGHPVRTTVSEMGPTLLARLLNLTDAQEGVLAIVFRVADDRGWKLIDLKDLRAMVAYVADHAAEFQQEYGNVPRQSAGSIQRELLQLQDAGADLFFGEPDIQITDWMRTSPDGRGYINILHCEHLFREPLLYSTFMLWLLSELFEAMPEVGDAEKPKLVFFFDEAHLLFNDAPKALIQKTEQVVKLIRSKGIGVYFITQQPSDIPNVILSQLGNRVQHALRAFTPAEQKAIKTAAQTFRANPNFDTEEAITNLGTGEALVSFLDEKGSPSVVEYATILPPQSSMGTIDDERRRAEIEADEMYGKYETAVDNESAYEVINEERLQLAKEQEEAEAAAEKAKEEEAAAKAKAKEEAALAKEREKLEKEREKLEREREKLSNRRSSYSRTSSSRRSSTSVVGKATSSAANTIGREIGKSIARGILGSLRR